MAGSVDTKKRIPTVVVLGHVDHGKTTLLDAIRNTDVQKREPMGITQNIYISEVEYKGKLVTFVDTPGHEVFSLMRAQGGKVADLALLIIAADEGVQPQTKESLDIIRREEIKFMVVVTKTDVEGANIDKVISQLAQEGVYLEGYGGDIPYVATSAVKKEGIDELLDTMFLYIEVEGLLDDTLAMLRLESSITDKELLKHIDGYGVVLDSKIDPHLGTTAFVIWRLGEATIKDTVYLQDIPVRLTKATDANHKPLNELIAGKAFILPSLDITPNPGDLLLFGKDSKKLAKQLERYYKHLRLRSKEPKAEEPKQSEDILDEIFAEDEETKKQRVNLIIKCDVEASRRSIIPTIKKFSNEYVEFNVISSAVGEVATSDIQTAKGFDAEIIGFRVPVSRKVLEIAKNENIKISRFDTVYQLYEYLSQIAEKIAQQFKEPEPIGRARVLKIFVLSDKSIVAGSVVEEGVVKRSAKVRVIRGQEKVAEYDIVDLRRFKERVSEVQKGMECGINLGKNADIKEGDILEFFSQNPL